MATYDAIVFPDIDFVLADRKTITLSGMVRNEDGEGLARKIVVYKRFGSSYSEDDVESYDVWAETVSGSDGSFSVDVYGGSNDEFRIVAIGNVGENSAIYEHVVET